MSLNLQLDLDNKSPLVFLGWGSNSIDDFLPWTWPYFHIPSHDLGSSQWLSCFCGNESQWLPDSSTLLAWLCPKASPSNTILHHRVPHQLSPTAPTCWNLKTLRDLLPHYLLLYGSFLNRIMNNWQLPTLCSQYPCCEVYWINLFMCLFLLVKSLKADTKYHIYIFLFPYCLL